MALQKNIELATGFTGTYINIAKVNIVHTVVSQIELGEIVKSIDKRFEVVVKIYKDASARQSEKLPVDIKTYSLDADFAYSHTNLLPAIYGLLKTLPQFSGALDV